AERGGDALVVVHAAAGRDLRIVPAVIVNQLAAAGEVRLQVWIDGVDHAAAAIAVDLLGERDGGGEIERVIIPVGILEHDEPEVAVCRPERLRTAPGRPAQLAAGLQAGDLAPGTRVDAGGVHDTRGVDLRLRQATTAAAVGLARRRAGQRLRIESAAR